MHVSSGWVSMRPSSASPKAGRPWLLQFGGVGRVGDDPRPEFFDEAVASGTAGG
ncbi:hypothetical protein [Cryobacterium sp. Hh38]|uniref:hypothetical protein n=1 Tax=Cryobacterium sp. Hh38 TaxID=1259156 RepID=UPI00141B74F5|nr:hypothetical protein [Cryobacterium sp. Hh38]